MFSMSIVDTDAFLEMPATSQLLYFHLSMRADDEGFVGNPKKIIKMGGFNDDDLRMLLTKRFILGFESGVVVIKHWLIHNTIRKDRFNPTNYNSEKNLLCIKENNAYTELGNQMATNGMHSIEEYSIDKNREELADASVLLGKDITLGENYKPDHTPPKKKKFIPTEKQLDAYGKISPIDYFHKEGVKREYEYLKEDDEQANKKFIGLARALVKRYPNNWKEVIDWWFEENNAWCDYHPSNFFSIGTWMKYDNKQKNRKEVYEL